MRFIFFAAFFSIIFAASLMLLSTSVIAECTEEQLAQKSEKVAKIMDRVSADPVKMRALYPKLLPLQGKALKLVQAAINQNNPNDPVLYGKLCDIVDKQLAILKGQ